MRLSRDRKSLLNHLESNDTIRPPYRITQMAETAVQEEVTRIWETSSDQEWYSYVQGTYDDTSRAKWIIRWFLWQAFVEESLE